MNVLLIPCGPTVNESERLAIEHLRSRLISVPGNDEWLLLTNLAFSSTDRRQSDEIDIVVVGPPGVMVIEVKHWTGAWVRRNRRLVENEADRVTAKARRVGTTLRRRIPNLGYVEGAFLVTEAPAKVVSLRDDTVRGVPFHTLQTWRHATGVDGQGVLSSQQVRMLGRTLEPTSAVSLDGTMKRFAGYTRLEILTHPNQRFHRVYKATHSSRQDPVILHVYDLSASEHSNPGERAEREWKSLQRLQQYSWAPRIVDSIQDAQGYVGEIKFFTITDPGAPSIEARSGDESWDPRARLSFAHSAIKALAQLHEAGTADEPMVHRNLSAKTVLVNHDNTPILTGFEYTRIPAEVTVASATEKIATDTWVAPEVVAQGRGAADCRSDVYSLCASLRVLFEARQDSVSQDIASLLAQGMDDDPDGRSTLDNLDSLLSDMMGEQVNVPPPPPARFWTEDQIVSFRGQHYRIVSRLGSGGVGITFKVVKVDPETRADLGTYVAKVARHEEFGQQVLCSYELAHSHLRHSALSTIFEVAQEWRENQFVALMTWIEGEPISEYTGVLPILAEDLHEASSEALVCRWLREACEALLVLHRNGLVHGDVSPRNMIVSGDSLVLTDYDCVTRLGKQAAAPGTLLYCSSSYLSGIGATPSDDIYALAASFFHVLFDREPFQYDGVRAKERGLNWHGLPRGDYPALASFLDRATNPDRDERFLTATDAITTLDRMFVGGGSLAVVKRELPNDLDSGADTNGSSQGPDRPIKRTENEVEWLQSLLQSYPGSRWGNSETRGLDTDFAATTYVETNLERLLYRDIVDRRKRLVVLCGNAGDGKTALLQHLAQRLGMGHQTSAIRILEGTLESGLTVRMNLDGSAAWRDRSADELLDEFLAPFHEGSPCEEIIHLLAINDGRLLEWIERVEQQRGETQLTTSLSRFLEDERQASNEELAFGAHIRFVNLNERSLVGGVTADGKSIDTSFLDRLVDSLYGGDQASRIWSPCRTCSAQERCEIYRATRLFGPDGLAEDTVRVRARRRLFESLQAVHLRGEAHITIRELRSALVYILFGVHWCFDYHKGDEGADPPTWQSYSERAFSPESSARQGEVLQEMVRLDPALEAHPGIDRALLSRRPFKEDRSVVRYSGLSLAEARRRAYFEWSDAAIQELTSDPCALDLAQGRHLREFRDLAIDDDSARRIDLTRRLCAGISRLETLPPVALDRPGAVSLQITPRTPTETALWIEKPLHDFCLFPDAARDGSEELEWLHRQAFLTFRFRDGHEERLRLSAELFHLLLELSDGYQLGDVATDDTFAQLSIFVQRLAQEDHRRLLAWNATHEHTIYEVLAKVENLGSSPRQSLCIVPLQQDTNSHEE